MNILIIGGSYFLGRTFVIVASKEKHSITLLNRGTYSMKEYGVKEFKLDRNNISDIKQIPANNYDAVIDFCAYKKNDIANIVYNLPGTIKKYVFISTCDVYDRNISGKKAESTPLSSVQYEGDVGLYISGKIELEKELECICKDKDILCSILRPGMIYGPYNYAPRESVYIQQIVTGKKLIFPSDSDSVFQFVYAKDVANAILKVLKQERIISKYNICSDEVFTYNKFLYKLKKVCDVKFDVEYMPSYQIISDDIFAPFPLFKNESQLYDGSKICIDCGLTYTSFEEGMKKTYNAFKHVYS